MTKFKIHEIFLSHQGEGTSVGRPAIFVRFAGCTLRCAFCDTEHERYVEMSQGVLVGKIKEILTRIGYAPYEDGFHIESGLQIILTGGEPLLQVTLPLVKELDDLGFYVCVETSGANEIMTEDRSEELIEILDKCMEVVVSPKLRGTNSDILARATCLKVLCPFDKVSLEESDVRGFVEKVGTLTEKVFQPVTPGLITSWRFGENLKVAMRLSASWNSKYGEEWRVIPQVHKFLNIR